MNEQCRRCLELEDTDCQADSHKLGVSSASVSFRAGLTCGLSREYLRQFVKHDNLAASAKSQPCHSLNDTVKDRLIDAPVTQNQEESHSTLFFLIAWKWSHRLTKES